MSGYGFIVLPEERKLLYNRTSNLDEGEDGTIFVDVETDWIPPSVEEKEKIVATLYYKSNFAEWNATTEEELKDRFPKSFAKNDAGEEYSKLRSRLDGEIWAQ
jgi:hypothetical protein